MNKVIFLFAFLLICSLYQCRVGSDEPKDTAVLYEEYCGSCHLLPNPTNIPASIWEQHVLPEMAARLGYRYSRYNPMAKLSMEEGLYVSASKIYPEQPIIDSTSWQIIHDYIIGLAPDSIPIDLERRKRNTALSNFDATPISLNQRNRLGITSISFDTRNHDYAIGDGSGALFYLAEPDKTIHKLRSPVSSYVQKDELTYITEMGYMNPSQIARGSLYRLKNGIQDTQVQKLHRPVYTEVGDINNNGKDEILISEFGNLTGQLSMLVESGKDQFERTNLLPLPGIIKTQIIDMNGDGRKDIVLLASQGKEGVYILYQEEDLQFRLEQVISLPPEYGSSWFELIDYNGDEHLDIVLVNGDNADYSNFLKPFHGIRIFLNEGANSFDEKWFYPIYGATRVLCEDYDLDGDLDFAVLSFFPDFQNAPEEGFVYLENKGSENFQFEAQTHSQTESGRWLIMEDGDYDQDGDLDLLLGSYFLPLDRQKYSNILSLWEKEYADLLLIENKTID